MKKAIWIIISIILAIIIAMDVFLFIVPFYRASFAFVLQRCKQRRHRAKHIPLKLHERIHRLPPGGSWRRRRLRESALQ